MKESIADVLRDLLNETNDKTGKTNVVLILDNLEKRAEKGDQKAKVLIEKYKQFIGGIK